MKSGRNARLSLFSSRINSSSREPSPRTQVSIHANQSNSCSTNAHGFVQSKTIIIAVCGNAVLGGTKWGSSARCAGEEDGTVYTDNLANVSVGTRQWPSALGRRKHHSTFVSFIAYVCPVVTYSKFATVAIVIPHWLLKKSSRESRLARRRFAEDDNLLGGYGTRRRDRI